MERKVQAAMEFLMTYGWAILAAIIAIAVLAYFGVFNPGRYTTEICSVSAPFVCSDDSVASASDGVKLILRNGGDVDYNMTYVSISNCGNATFGDVVITSGSQNAINDLAVSCDTTLVEGAAFRGNIEVSYQAIGGTRILTSTGSITRKKVTA